MGRINIRDRIVIDPARITLKPLNSHDVSDAYVDWLNDPEINKYLEIRHSVPISKQDVIDFVDSCNKTGRYHWGIFYDGKHLGNISCSRYSRRYNWVSVSTIIGKKEFRNSNLAKFSLAGAMEYFFIKAKFHRIQAGVYSINLFGITLLTYLGFRREGRLRQNILFEDQYIDTLLYAITRDDWISRKAKFPPVAVGAPSWEPNK